nr:efflux RND transporter permease subunit [Eubacterium sp.]
MIKESVKKPYLILVFVIVIMMLAGVSLTRMTTDLLPSIDTPYLIVITTYPGASPEKVELEVTEPVESVLSTVSNVETYTSQSAENYGLTMLQFTDGTDMDAALVNVYTSIETIKDSLPDSAGEPQVMEISMDMLATMYLCVSNEGMDVYELSDYVDEELKPYIQRVEGVASVSTIGLVEDMFEVRLDAEKIEGLNDKLAASVSDELAEAKEALDDAQSEIDSGSSKLDDAADELDEQETKTSKELAKYTKQLNKALATQSAYEATLTSLKASKAALEAEKKAYEDA